MVNIAISIAYENKISINPDRQYAGKILSTDNTNNINIDEETLRYAHRGIIIFIAICAFLFVYFKYFHSGEKLALGLIKLVFVILNFIIINFCDPLMILQSLAIFYFFSIIILLCQSVERTTNIGIPIIIILILMTLIRPQVEKSRWQARQKACYSNIRNITSAIDMYNMDNVPMMTNIDFKKLVENKYLNIEPKCPETGTSSAYIAIGNLSTNGEISCGPDIIGGNIKNHGKYHGTIDPIIPPLPKPPLIIRFFAKFYKFIMIIKD